MEFLRGVAKAFADSAVEEELKGEVEGFRHTLFIFPSRRSSKFFMKYLGICWAQRFSKPLLTPQVCTISDLFRAMGGLAEVEAVEASVLLYREYVKLTESKESFDEFLRWGEVLLADFNDIDNYLIDAKAIFTNIRELKELDGDLSYLSESQIEAIRRFWSSFHANPHRKQNGRIDKIDIKREFSGIWAILPDLYTNFKERLLQEGKGYNGMIYRSVAQRIEAGEKCWEREDIDKFVFIGFNAPNKCEEVLLKAVKMSGCGDFYWDFASPLVRDKDNKASLWVEKLEKDFPSAHPEYLNCITEDGQQTQINVIAVPGSVQQAELAGEILGGIKDEDHFKSAVVLPQENMLFPLLNNIPDEYTSVNVSMGYPMELTPLGAFMNRIILLLKGMNSGRFYHKDVKGVLESDCIKEVLYNETAHIMEAIVKRNLIYVRQDEILDMIEKSCINGSTGQESGNDDSQEERRRNGIEVLKTIFSVQNGCWQDTARWQMEILKALDLISDRLSKEFIALQYKAISKILEYSELDEITIDTFLRIESSLFSGISIPFEGEPLRGLQVIGPLETRALDFENLIILNVNEGIFPKAYSSNSFIPYMLRKGFGLPTFELADAVSAYHFYRGIYRSRRVWLLYDTRSEGMRSGEVSRFVQQLKYHHRLKVKEYTAQNVSLAGGAEHAMEVEKSAEVMDKLRKRFIVGEGEKTKAFSATSLIDYLYCPLQFYLKDVLDIKEEEEVEEGMEANTFGTIFHAAMEELYAPFTGKDVEKGCLEKYIREIDNAEGPVQRILLEQFRRQRLGEPKGENYISFKVLLKCIELTLKQDAGTLYGSTFSAPFHYMGSEKKVEFNLAVNDEITVRVKAKIDRLDSRGGKLRVSDYKTGFVENMTREEENKLPESLFPTGEKEFSHKVWFQLYFYAMMLLENGDMKDETLDAAVYKIRSMTTSPIAMRSMSKGEIEKYREKLKETIAEIFNPEIPFFQARPDSRRCEHCIFRSICKR